MKGRKILSFAMVFVLLSTLSLPSSASKMKTKVTATTKLPVIRVVVPTTGSAIINPRRLSVKIYNTLDSSPILSTTQCMANMSDAAIWVSCTVSGEVNSASSMELVPYSTDGMTTKAAHMFFELKEITAAQVEDVDSIAWSKVYNDNYIRHIIVQKEPVTKENMLKMSAASIDGEPVSYAAFHLAGDVVKAPDTKWTSSDSVTVTVAFTFTPVPLS